MVQDITDLIGRRIGSYRIEELIGAGGYARVYKAIDDTIGRQTAIKVLIPAPRGDGTAGGYSDKIVGRFEREARILAKLRDPHSVQMYEFGRTDDGLLYMIFEFIEGRTLAEVRRKEAPLAPLRVVKILEQVLLSLEEAHALGLVHRDIKPQNIMVFEHVGRRDQVKVLDFGVGKSFASEFTADLTADGTLIGTPRYMAPEQWSSDGDITPATDIYALGHVAYELLTGQRVIEGAEPVHIMRAHLEPTPFALPASLDIPSGLRRVVDRMMVKDPAARYRSAGQVLADLSRLKPAGVAADTMDLDERELDDTTTAQVRPSPFEQSSDAVPAPGRLETTSGRRDATTATTTPGGARRLAAVAVVALAVAAAAAAFVFLGDGSGGAETTEAQPVVASERPQAQEPARGAAAPASPDQPSADARTPVGAPELPAEREATAERIEAAQREESAPDPDAVDEPTAEADATVAPPEPAEAPAAEPPAAETAAQPARTQQPRPQPAPEPPHEPDNGPEESGRGMNIFTLD